MTTPGWASGSDAEGYGTEILSGERVRLRATTDDDLTELAEWWNRPAPSPLQQSVVKPRPVPPVVEMFRLWSENRPDSAEVGFSIVRNTDDALIGHTTLYGATPITRASEFAIVIGPDFVGQGLGTEAVKLMVSYGFRELGLNRIGLSVWAYNTRARRSYANAGFREEGRRREVTFHDGRFHDEILLGVLASEFWATR